VHGLHAACNTLGATNAQKQNRKSNTDKRDEQEFAEYLCESLEFDLDADERERDNLEILSHDAELDATCERTRVKHTKLEEQKTLRALYVFRVVRCC
jgi:DNA polymerase III delta subunit